MWNINAKALKHPSLPFSLRLVPVYLLGVGGVTAGERRVAHANDCKIICFKKSI